MFVDLFANSSANTISTLTIMFLQVMMLSTGLVSQRESLVQSKRAKQVYYLFTKPLIEWLNCILFIMSYFAHISCFSLQRTEKFSKSAEPGRRARMNLEHPRIFDVQNHRFLSLHCPKFLLSLWDMFHEVIFVSNFFCISIFVASWNVAGRSPPCNLNLDEWLHAAPPADIYVLGYNFRIRFVHETWCNSPLTCCRC